MLYLQPWFLSRCHFPFSHLSFSPYLLDHYFCFTPKINVSFHPELISSFLIIDATVQTFHPVSRILLSSPPSLPPHLTVTHSKLLLGNVCSGESLIPPHYNAQVFQLTSIRRVNVPISFHFISCIDVLCTPLTLSASLKTYRCDVYRDMQLLQQHNNHICWLGRAKDLRDVINYADSGRLGKFTRSPK